MDDSWRVEEGRVRGKNVEENGKAKRKSVQSRHERREKGKEVEEREEKGEEEKE